MKFTTARRKVYSGLIKYPELSDKALAEKLNLKILAFLYFKLNLNLSKKDKLKFAKAITKLRSNIFMVISNDSSPVLMPFKDFNDYKKITNSFAEISEISGILREEVKTLLFSIPEARFIKEYSFAEITKKLLG